MTRKQSLTDSGVDGPIDAHGVRMGPRRLKDRGQVRRRRSEVCIGL